ncbi:MAG: GNAT family N-acetyltransferase [Chitinophagaceae bacterium]
MLKTKLVGSDEELAQILQLQLANTKPFLSDRDMAQQGFVTVSHTPAQLRHLHDIHPSVIVKEGDMLAGYALVMPRECANVVPVLVPAFKALELLVYKGKSLEKTNWYLIGQVCVAKTFRGTGVFKMLYDGHRQFLQNHYQYCITEISTSNKRSLRAHEKVGFKMLHQFADAKDEWAIVIWDWK